MAENRVGQAGIFYVVIPAHKEPSYFSMLESILWHKKQKLQMQRFQRWCNLSDPRKLSFGHFFSSIILPPISAGEKVDLQKTLYW